jgi:hypothetical protein
MDIRTGGKLWWGSVIVVEPKYQRYNSALTGLTDVCT